MTTTLRLLIVEDSEDDALLLERELKKNGYELDCERVDTPEEMQSALAAKVWDLVISDFVMPRFSGLGALQILRESAIDIPFIVVSGKIGEETAVEAMRAGAHDYILKGNLARLAPAVEREMVDAEVRRKRRQAEDNLRKSEVRYQLAEEERYKMELQFQQTQKMESLGVLAGGIAHDFNNILTVILGHCSMARAHVDSKQSLEAHFQQIEIAANRAANLCRQMLTYAGKSPMMQTRVNMWLLMDETVKMLKSAIKMNVTIEADINKDISDVIGDATQIQQVVMNLIINAAEAIGDSNGTIKVSLTMKTVQSEREEFDYIGSGILPGVYACMMVSDNGCGMDEVTKMRIFEPFFTTKFTGRGLGMSAILGIVKSHSGALQIESTPGIGTTFTVLFPLPIAVETAKVAQAGGSNLSDTLHGKILLVDDEEALRTVGSSLLNAMGFTVVTAANGREAMKIFRQQGSGIDVVMLDFIMTEMDGLEVYRELRTLSEKLPVIICSGYGAEEIAEVIKNDGYAGFILKPYKPGELRDVLMKLRGGV